MNMKAPTDKKRQWLWFVALWCGGLTAALILGYLVRLLITST
ncbi:MAG: hypothetical protein QNI92_05380 [Desulfobacterales bacterium]|nr:hypothetical protein [Desulfobacterales bacterium]MDJ0912366.1 hypothetical protein [Desulfobacterales bacterium]